LRGLDADLLRRSGQPYLFVLYTALCLSYASDWEGTLIRELGSESLARHHLFPRSLFRTVGEEEGYVSGIGNITLISPSLNSELSDRPPAEYLHQYRDELRKHFIPEERELWKKDRFEEFCERRAKLIRIYIHTANDSAQFGPAVGAELRPWLHRLVAARAVPRQGLAAVLAEPSSLHVLGPAARARNEGHGRLGLRRRLVGGLLEERRYYGYPRSHGRPLALSQLLSGPLDRLHPQHLRRRDP
jgi:hypothetical protein